MKKQSIWVFQWRKSVHYWWSYILFSPECKELTSMLDPLLYRWGVPPVVIRCVHWTMQMWVLQTWIKALGLYIVMVDFQFPLLAVTFWTMMALELFLAVNEQMAREIVLPWKWFVTYLATVHPCCRLDRCFLELLHLKTGIGSLAGLIYIAREESISW